MSPETRSVRTSKLCLTEFVYSQNDSWSLTPKGRLFLELVQINTTLSNADNKRVTFAISPQIRQCLLERRQQITQGLGLDEDEIKFSRQNRLVAKITQKTGIAPHRIYSLS